MVFLNHINFYSLAKLFVAKKMVFVNHINCYGLAKTIILVMVLPDYIYG